jgi:hypothetical protein
MNQKIRRGPRYPFIAVAEIAHTESGGNLVAGSPNLVLMAAT